jgi:hypothetical protein
MLTYNFSYSHQQGISSAYNYPYSTSNSGNTLVLNFSMPNSYYDGDDYGGIGNTGDKSNDEFNKAKDDLDKVKAELDQCKNDPNKFNKGDFDKVKVELDKCKDDPNKFNKSDFDKVKDELDKCKTDPDKCNKVDFDKIKAELDKYKDDLSKCNKDEIISPDKDDNAGVITPQIITSEHKLFRLV